MGLLGLIGEAHSLPMGPSLPPFSSESRAQERVRRSSAKFFSLRNRSFVMLLRNWNSPLLVLKPGSIGAPRAKVCCCNWTNRLNPERCDGEVTGLPVHLDPLVPTHSSPAA